MVKIISSFIFIFLLIAVSLTSPSKILADVLQQTFYFDNSTLCVENLCDPALNYHPFNADCTPLSWWCSGIGSRFCKQYTGSECCAILGQKLDPGTQTTCVSKATSTVLSPTCKNPPWNVHQAADAITCFWDVPTNVTPTPTPPP